jgi:hypothetical protein
LQKTFKAFLSVFKNNIMKYFLLLSAVLCATNCNAQSNTLSGNWREVQRSDKSGNVIPFGDTIKIGFLSGNEYTWLKKGGFIYRGTYKIENGNLDMGSRLFKIEHLGSQRLRLADDEAIYVFRPYTPAAANELPAEPDAQPVMHIGDMVGKWKVYKGTSDKTIKELDLANRIKTVMIFDRPDPQGDIGYISGGKDPQGSPSWKINRFENNIFYCNGKSVRLFQVSMKDDHLILQEEPRTYFLNQFRE